MKDIRLIQPYIAFDDVEEDFREVFRSGMFTKGQNVAAFRREIATYVGTRHAFVVTSATTALWTSLKALGIGAGDEVVVSDFSFPASANVIEDLGARPVFADVDLGSYNMLPEELGRKITSRTKAVMFVAALGNPTGVSEIAALCSERRLPLIEDAACALGSSEGGRRSGSIADLSCFSFHPRKLINTGEGGAITTASDEWARWLEIKLAHGADGSLGAGLDFVDYGYNFRLSELQCVMGRHQLARLDEIVASRNEVRKAYDTALAPLGFTSQALGNDVVHNVQSLVCRVPAGWDRDSLVTHLRARRIETTLGTYAMSASTFYRHRYADVQPNSALLERTTITLPCYAGIDLDRVVAAIADFAPVGARQQRS